METRLFAKFSIKKLLSLTLISLVSVSLLTLSSCSDEIDDMDDGTTAEPSYFPEIEGADGILAAVKTLTFISGPFPVTTELGIGVAAFFEGDGFVNAGTVDLDGNTLSTNPNNSYTYTPSMTDPTGLEFGSNVNWKISGGSGFPSIDQTTTFGWPTIGAITSGGPTSGDLTVTVDFVTNADSVIYHIAGPSGNVLETLAGNATSHTFTAAEVASTGSGSGLIQVTAYKFGSIEESGKTLFAVNEVVVNEVVEFP